MKLIGHIYRFQRLPHAHGTQLIVWRHTSAKCTSALANMQTECVDPTGAMRITSGACYIYRLCYSNNHQRSSSDEDQRLVLRFNCNAVETIVFYTVNIVPVSWAEWHINCETTEKIWRTELGKITHHVSIVHASYNLHDGKAFRWHKCLCATCTSD